MKTVVVFLIGVALIISIGLAAFVAFVRTGEYLKVSQDTYTLEVQKAKNEAVDGCFKSAMVTTSSASGAKLEPSMDIYELCLKDKGFGVSIK